MIYFSGISIKHLERWELPDDRPRFSTAEDSYRLFLGMHLTMIRACEKQGEYDPNYNRYLSCVQHCESRLRLSFIEFRNVVANLVVLYQQLFTDPTGSRGARLMDTIGKFERLIYLYTNKLPSRFTTA
jgi:hypothetical protein